MATPISRRQVLAFSAAFAAGGAFAQQPADVRKPYLADMHSHYGMFLPRLFGLDLAKHMRETGTTLLAWSATDDNRWIGLGPLGWKQVREPKPGELWDHFRARLAGYEAKLAEWQVPKALTPADIDAALAGEPRVLLATEAANFLEGRPERVAQAHAWGIRHMQMVHYIQSPLGDYQTAQPQHGGITELGRQVVRECRRHGIVVDLAHATPAFIDGALDAAADVQVVWSHSWIHRQDGMPWNTPGYLARSLPLASARKIAARGGAIGLWALRVSGDPMYGPRNVATFADEMMRMCDLVGPAHVAFGTDMEGVGTQPILNSYVDLHDVADNLSRRGVAEATLHGIFIGNYARIVKAAMQGAKA
ncbi:dipeptidase [Ramlibacter albus]|uniref:Membrane dipeptidase n=1 Tax=Ramlibacter albus TaxID=2079448 RepID=A0A923M7I2_9BURK|nr:membrane dipeptidase [Ramlibacter albus]MBC5764246.1 membrane dipeptidase [Ramlibacter albus]